MNISKYSDVVSSAEVFEGIGLDELMCALDTMRAYITTYEEGQYLRYVGDTLDAYPVVLQGSVQAYMIKTGQRHFVAEFFAGDSFGEAIPSTLKVTPVDMYCPCATVVLFMPHNNFRYLDTDIASLLQDNLKKQQDKKMSTLISTISLLSEPNLADRVLHYLQGREKDKDGYIDIGLTRAEWASYLRVAEKSLSRTLGVMKKDGLIEVSGRKIRIIK